MQNLHTSFPTLYVMQGLGTSFPPRCMSCRVFVQASFNVVRHAKRRMVCETFVQISSELYVIRGFCVGWKAGGSKNMPN